MTAPSLRERLRADWQADRPAPAAPLPVNPATVLPPGILYNEFDYHQLAYRHVGAAVEDLLGEAAAELDTDPLAAWMALLPDVVVELFTTRLLPELADALRTYAPPTVRFYLHLTYPLDKTVPYRIVEHHLKLQTDPDTRLPLSHREWIQPSLRQTSTPTVHLQLLAADQRGNLTPVLARTYRPPTVFDTALSRREREIAHHMITGSSSAQIAEQYFISVHTVSSHRRNILLKTGTKHTAELIWLAASLGWAGQASERPSAP